MQNLVDFFEMLLSSEQLIRNGGLAMLLIIVFAETGIFIGFIFPGDALLFTAGVLCGTRYLQVNIFALLILILIAAVLGNLLGFATGRYLGKRLFHKKDTWFFKQKHLEMTRLFYQKYGGISLIAGRFIWIVRTFVPIFAGAIEMNFWKFNFFNVAGGILWVGSLVTAGFFLGRQVPDAAENLEYIIAGITVVIMSILITGIIKVRRSTRQN